MLHYRLHIAPLVLHKKTDLLPLYITVLAVDLSMTSLFLYIGTSDTLLPAVFLCSFSLITEIPPYQHLPAYSVCSQSNQNIVFEYFWSMLRLSKEDVSFFSSVCFPCSHPSDLRNFADQVVLPCNFSKKAFLYIWCCTRNFLLSPQS